MLSRVAIGVLLGAALALGGCDRETPAGGQANAALPDAANALTPDEVAPDAAAKPVAAAGKVDRSHRGTPAPAIQFLDPQGNTTTLAAYRGTPVLLNLWATWCAPCIKELPSLENAAAAHVGRLTVLAVSQDMEAGKAAPFLAERKLVRLKPYADPDMGLSLHYKVNLPTTILFDRDGREVWRVPGAFEWDSEEANKLIAEA